MKTHIEYPYETINQEIKDGCDKGIYCSHCGQLAKKYRRVMGSNIARCLVRLYLAQQRYDRYYTTRELYPGDNKSSTDGVYARYWGLIDVAEAYNEGGAPVGSYHLTELGRRFVMGVEYIKSHAYIYNKELLSLDGKLVDIKAALGKKFSYDDLMAGR